MTDNGEAPGQLVIKNAATLLDICIIMIVDVYSQADVQPIRAGQERREFTMEWFVARVIVDFYSYRTSPCKGIVTKGNHCGVPLLCGIYPPRTPLWCVLTGIEVR
jgi:hypothetical protein